LISCNFKLTLIVMIMEEKTVKKSAKQKKKKTKKRKFKILEIKLSSRQTKSLANYCVARKTTPNKLIKKSISRYLNGFEKEVPKEFYVSERQLNLFE